MILIKNSSQFQKKVKMNLKSESNIDLPIGGRQLILLLKKPDWFILKTTY